MKHGIRLLATALSLLILCGLVYASNKRNGIYQSPVTLWADMVKTSPNKRRAHENYGQALSTVGYYKDALREFNTVLALPDDGSVPMRDLYREIGVVQFRIEQFDDAIVSWQKGLRYAPNDASLLNNLSIAFLRKGRFDEAVTSARIAVASNPMMPQPLNTLGEAYLAKKDFAKAAECFVKSIELAPDDPGRYWNAAIAFEKAGNFEGAYQYINRFMAIERDARYRQSAMEFLNYVNKMRGLKAGG